MKTHKYLILGLLSLIALSSVTWAGDQNQRTVMFDRTLTVDKIEDGFSRAPQFEDTKGGFSRAPQFEDTKGGFSRAPQFEDTKGGFSRAPQFEDTKGGFSRAPQFEDTKGGFSRAPQFGKMGSFLMNTTSISKSNRQAIITSNGKTAVTPVFMNLRQQAENDEAVVILEDERSIDNDLSSDEKMFNDKLDNIIQDEKLMNVIIERYSEFEEHLYATWDESSKTLKKLDQLQDRNHLSTSTISLIINVIRELKIDKEARNYNLYTRMLEEGLPQLLFNRIEELIEKENDLITEKTTRQKEEEDFDQEQTSGGRFKIPFMIGLREISAIFLSREIERHEKQVAKYENYLDKLTQGERSIDNDLSSDEKMFNDKLDNIIQDEKLMNVIIERYPEFEEHLYATWDESSKTLKKLDQLQDRNHLSTSTISLIIKETRSYNLYTRMLEEGLPQLLFNRIEELIEKENDLITEKTTRQKEEEDFDQEQTSGGRFKIPFMIGLREISAIFLSREIERHEKQVAKYENYLDKLTQ